MKIKSAEILDLGNNQIEEMQKEILDVVMNLEELRLNNNLLETIPGLTFACLKELKTLDLESEILPRISGLLQRPYPSLRRDLSAGV